jgi:threonine aldolase
MQVDLRSDTFTKPTADMLHAMMSAEVGDDVFQEDPTVNELENQTAKYFGFEAGLFCASGTMANQVAISTHVGKGDEVICEKNSHVYYYEGGAIAAMAGASVRTLEGDKGRLYAQVIEDHINPDNIHYPITRLVSIENTANRGGGSCYDQSELLKIHELCKKHKLSLHIDGARVWNAIKSKNEEPTFYGKIFDTASICFSKGLGTPVGSVLCGSHDFVKNARRVRKRFGGGWRQAGYLAAACIYALHHHVDRIAEDHRRASQISEILKKQSFVQKVHDVESNIILFDVTDVSDVIQQLAERGIKCLPFGKNTIRMITHLDINDAMIDYFEQSVKMINNKF